MGNEKPLRVITVNNTFIVHVIVCKYYDICPRPVFFYPGKEVTDGYGSVTSLAGISLDNSHSWNSVALTASFHPAAYGHLCPRPDPPHVTQQSRNDALWYLHPPRTRFEILHPREENGSHKNMGQLPL